MKFKVIVRNQAGRKVTKTVDSLALARKVEAKFKTLAVEEQVFGKEFVKKPKPLVLTLADAWDKFLPWAKSNKKSWKDDQSRWTHHVEPYLAKGRLDRITPGDIQGLLDRMPEHAPATRKLVLALVKRLFNWSIKAGHYDGLNPALRVEAPKFDNSVTNPLTREDLGKLLDGLESFQNPHFRLVVLFALFSGKRRGEILKLKWADVDLVNGFVTYRQTKGGSTQSLPMNESCRGLLEEAKLLSLNCQICFPCSTGTHYHSFDATWRRFRKRYKLEGYRFHDLRHTFASYLASSGQVDIYTLKELLGHKSLTMTQRYAHLINGALKKAVSVADKAFNAPEV
jgi:integrase